MLFSIYINKFIHCLPLCNQSYPTNYITSIYIIVQLFNWLTTNATTTSILYLIFRSEIQLNIVGLKLTGLIQPYSKKSSDIRQPGPKESKCHSPRCRCLYTFTYLDVSPFIGKNVRSTMTKKNNEYGYCEIC